MSDDRAAAATVTCEVCTESLDGARAALRGGADRIELCSALALGGLTPSAGLLRLVREHVPLDVVVLVRPRAGDFVYAPSELDTLHRDVDLAREAGARGVALGVLTADDAVDVDALTRLVAAARPMDVTFHRAFDLLADPLAALPLLAELGVRRILTSGGAPGVRDGLALLARLVDAAPPGLQIMPGGGVRPENVADVLRGSGARQVHFSARRSVAVRPSPARSTAIPDLADDGRRVVTDEDTVRAIVRAARAACGGA